MRDKSYIKAYLREILKYAFINWSSYILINRMESGGDVCKRVIKIINDTGHLDDLT